MVVLEAFENYVWVMGNRRGRNESLSDKRGDRARELSWAMKSVLGWGRGVGGLAGVFPTDIRVSIRGDPHLGQCLIPVPLRP